MVLPPGGATAGCDNRLVPELATPQPQAALRAGFDAAAGLVHLLGRRRYLISDSVANAAFALQPRRREVTAANFQAVFPQLGRRQARRLAARSYREYARTSLDFLYVHHLSRARLLAGFRAHGVEILHQLQAERRGAILLLFHHGAWDAGGAYASAVGLPLTSVMADEGAPALRDLVIWARAEIGMRVVPASQSARVVLETLRGGGLVALLADIPGDTPAVEVDFLGRRTKFSALPSRLAEHTGCPLIPVVSVRSPAGGYFIEVHPPHHLIPGDDPEAGLRPVLEVFERTVRRWPEQWYPFGEDRLRGPAHD